VETAAHGLECVEKLMLFREVTLVRWKKWMELEHGEASRAQHFLVRAAYTPPPLNLSHYGAVERNSAMAAAPCSSFLHVH